MQPPQRITLQLVDGPFRQLEGHWHFQSLTPSASKVDLDLNFEFSAGPAALLLRPVFNHIADSLVTAFVDRAHSLYPAA